MKVLAIADVEERCLWDFYSEKRFGDVDLILSAGDLDPDYLEFLVTVTNKPLLYVRGNHDDRYARRAPGGCLCVEDEVYVYRGLRVAGLGGSMRYRDGANMYSEREMARRAQRLQAKIRLAGGVDVLLTHAPARGWATSRTFRTAASSASTTCSGAGGPATWSTATCTRATTPPSSASGRCLAARRWSMPADTPSSTSRGRAAGIAAGAPRG